MEDASVDIAPELADQLYAALGDVDRDAVGAVIARALVAASPLQVAEYLIGPVLNRLGDGWSSGTVALSQLYLGGRLCEEQIIALLPDTDLVRADAPRVGIAALVDRHALGKRIVATFLRIAGYPVIDYGVGITPEQLAASARVDGLDVLLVSTLMLPSALQVERLTALLRDHRVKVFVGGAPFRFDPELWRAVGADGMGSNASDALTLVQSARREPS